jgi:Tfp pilus assembly protein PilX
MQVRTYRPLARAQRGVSLIITLLMLVIIGLTAGAAMRSAISSEKVINNLRSETLAQQYAEAALRYCEQQMALVSASRATGLKDADITTTAFGATTQWSLTTTWAGAAPKRVMVPGDQFKNSDSSFFPSTAPECYVEKQTLADGRAWRWW